MAAKPAHKLVKNDVVLVKDKAGATIASRTVTMVRLMSSGVIVKFTGGISKLYRRGERVYL